MAEKPQAAETEAKTDPAAKRHRRRKIAVGAAVTAAVLIGAGAWLARDFLNPPVPAAQQAQSGVGIMDVKAVMEAHPQYGELQQLRGEEQSLALQLQDLMTLEPPELTVEPPEVDAKPFEDSVWQKNAQTVIGGRFELEREAKRLRTQYKQEHEAEYLARSTALDDAYRNTILNIQIKLDNAGVMGLSQSSVTQLQQELEAVKRERGERHWQQYQAWQKEISDYVQSVMGPKLSKWRQEAEQAKAQQQADALAKQSAAQSRDTDAMQQQMDFSKNMQDRDRVKQKLLAKQDEVNALEAHILNDIAGRAAKLSILHHFTLMLTSPARTMESLFPYAVHTGAMPEAYEPVIGVDTTDVTDEMVSEMQSLTPQDK